MKTNRVPGHFDFMIEMTFIKIACACTLGLIPWGLIGTHTIVSYACTYVMLLEQEFIFNFGPSSANQKNNNLSERWLFVKEMERYV